MTIILNFLLNLFYTKHHLNNEFVIDFSNKGYKSNIIKWFKI